MLEMFHPLIAAWFRERYGEATRVQAECWPAAAEGKHILATAPTGSGKTLAAFLWFLDGMASGRLPTQGLSVLYVSPLKALNSDIRENLLRPLKELGEYFSERGAAFPEVRVMVRSGDSSPKERRLMLKRPPSILITTPESLAILVNSNSGSQMLSTAKTLILDEIHAVAGTKRGAFLMAAVERLTEAAGEFQRLALSATVKPLGLAAEFVGGMRRVGTDGYLPRAVEIIDAGGKRAFELMVEAPGKAPEFGQDETPSGTPDTGSGRAGAAWDDIAKRLVKIINGNRSTIVFTNSRRVAEQAAFLVNRAAGAELAYVHHGSLSKDVRRSVEARMKAGALRAIVATSSLELGIDVGEVDEVVLLGAPPQTAQALQRLGRSGHGPGRTVKGRFMPLHDVDVLRCAILSEAVLAGDIDELKIPENPLDVLSQLVMGLCARQSLGADELYALSRRSFNFRNLPRDLFDAVIESLEGYRAGNRVRGLKRRLFRDAADGSYSASPGTAVLLAMAGGTIPDRGYFTLKHSGSEAVIGELDEEFVWERRQGEGFSLGNQRWRIVSIGDKDVHVVPWKGDVNMLPFWKAERQWRSAILSERALAFLDIAGGLEGEELEKYIGGRFSITREATARLAALIRGQARSAGLSGMAKVAVERWRDPLKPSGGLEVVIHTQRGNGINYPLMLAIKETFREKAGFEPEAFSDNDSIVLSLPPETEAAGLDVMEALGGLGGSESILAKLKPLLQSSGVFGASFRENAIRALMVPRSTFGKRMPLWLMRARAKALLDEVSRLPDFPIVAETWRECLRDQFDMEGLGAFLDGLADGRIALRAADTRVPSPFARGVLWQETNEVLYRGDASNRRIASSLSENAVKAAAGAGGATAALRPETMKAFEDRVRRLVPGWAPRGRRETESHLSDRIAVGRGELEGLFGDSIRATPQGLEILFAQNIDGTAPDAEAPLELLKIGPGAGGRGSYAVESRGREILASRADPERERLLAEWSRFSGPFTADGAGNALGWEANNVESILEALAEKGILIRLDPGSGFEGFCDAQNLESLYRLQRRLLRPEIETRPADDLASFLAASAGIDRPGSGLEGTRQAIDSLIAWPARPQDWEESLFPARVKDYSPALLDGTIQGSDLFFFGLPRAAQGPDEEESAKAARGPGGKAAFAFPWEFDLIRPRRTADAALADPKKTLGSRPRRFWDVKDGWGREIDETIEALWEAFFRGEGATSSFQALRVGIRDGFSARPSPVAAAKAIPGPGRVNRIPADRWKSGAPIPGDWFDPRAISEGPADHADNAVPDALDEAEILRERVRIILKRRGILFRGLLERELPELSFSALFPAMRRMELSGELMAGLYFQGIQGPQFMSPEGLRLFRALDGSDAAVYVLSAIDPASLAGLGIEGLSAPLPPRAPQNALVYRGSLLLMASRKSGAEIDLFSEEFATEAFSALSSWLDRKARSAASGRARIQSINGENALSSPFAEAAKSAGFTQGYRWLEYYPRA